MVIRYNGNTMILFEGVFCLALRASSGKHARLVWVCPAGGDSIPADPGDPRRAFFWLDYIRLIGVSTSGKLALNRWFLFG